jgi:hypothetical protein
MRKISKIHVVDFLLRIYKHAHMLYAYLCRMHIFRTIQDSRAITRLKFRVSMIC